MTWVIIPAPNCHPLLRISCDATVPCALLYTREIGDFCNLLDYSRLDGYPKQFRVKHYKAVTRSKMEAHSQSVQEHLCLGFHLKRPMHATPLQTLAPLRELPLSLNCFQCYLAMWTIMWNLSTFVMQSIHKTQNSVIPRLQQVLSPCMKLAKFWNFWSRRRDRQKGDRPVFFP